MGINEIASYFLTHTEVHTPFTSYKEGRGATPAQER